LPWWTEPWQKGRPEFPLSAGDLQDRKQGGVTDLPGSLCAPGELEKLSTVILDAVRECCEACRTAPELAGTPIWSQLSVEG